jgi:hypothetical protein
MNPSVAREPVRAAAAWCAAAVLMCAPLAQAADFGSPGGPPPANIDATAQTLRQDPYDLELLISYGTSKGGSAGHLALAIREPGRADDTVYSANFYADRETEHAKDFYTDDLMVRVPKMEYLFGTSSSLGDKASFGLDYGEVYKRSVIGVRVFGVPDSEKQALAAFFARVNDDYRQRVSYTNYHGAGEVKYGYLSLNCAKTIGMGFKLGAGYEDLEVKNVNLVRDVSAVAALTANIPTEMAMKLMKAWHARAYGIDVVLYKKYGGSGWVDPHDEDQVAFKDLPNRFPSVLSRDFRKEQGQYEDVDNLFAMYLLYNLGRYSVRIDDATRRLEIDTRKTPKPYPRAAELANRNARSDRDNFGRGPSFQTEGSVVGHGNDPRRLSESAGEGDKK